MQTQRTSKRQKTVFTTSELPHIWAHQSQHSGRTPHRNFYFEGDTIYSYGSHFPIARHVTHNGKRVIFFTTQDYSVTTSGHKNEVRSAIPRDVRVFYVECVHDTPKECFDRMRKGIAKLRSSIKSAANVVSREKRATDLMREIRRVNEFAEHFGYRTRIEAHSEWIELETAGRARKTLRDQRARDLAEWRRNNPTEAQRLDRERREAAIERTRAEREAALESWRNGGSRGSYSFHGMPVAVRIIGDEMETSLGASFPLEHAKRAAPIVRRLLERGESYQRNGHSIHLGSYVIDRIDSAGTMTAGCHVIERAELLKILEMLEGIPA